MTNEREQCGGEGRFRKDGQNIFFPVGSRKHSFFWSNVENVIELVGFFSVRESLECLAFSSTVLGSERAFADCTIDPCNSTSIKSYFPLKSMHVTSIHSGRFWIV